MNNHLTKALAQLPCFDQIKHIDSIDAGLSQQCFKVVTTTKTYFAKTQELATQGFININSLVAKKGISPVVIYQNKQWLVTEFIEGKALSAQKNMNRADKIKIAIDLMSQCHQLSAQLDDLAPDIICADLINEANLSSDKKNELGHFANELLDTLKNVDNALNNQVGKAPLVCCHGDLNFSNIMVDESNQTWLIDYECASLAPAEFDLAMFIAINQLSAHEVLFAVQHYQQHRNITLCEKLIQAYLTFCYFINGLWYFNAFTKHPQQNEFRKLALAQWQKIGISSDI
jgi:thiamine kinase-like enzyme